jgi:hypothetical protein
MKRLMVLVSFALVTAAGCGGSGKVENYDGLLAKMSGFKDEMCKCADAACAKKVYDGMGKWAVGNSDVIENAKPSTAQQEAMRALEGEFKACQAKAKGE